ncbi:signal peptide protein [Lentibacillus halophilus]
MLDIAMLALFIILPMFMVGLAKWTSTVVEKGRDE